MAGGAAEADGAAAPARVRSFILVVLKPEGDPMVDVRGVGAGLGVVEIQFEVEDISSAR